MAGKGRREVNGCMVVMLVMMVVMILGVDGDEHETTTTISG